jgi:hypothetical protein
VEIFNFAHETALFFATELSLFRNLPVTVLLPGLYCPATGGMLFKNP